MASVRRIVLDVLKPHEPELLEFAQYVSDTDGVEGINVSVIEIDRKVQNVTLTIEGEDLDYESIHTAVKEQSGTVHSVDEVACGEYLVNESKTSSLVQPAWLR